MFTFISDAMFLTMRCLDDVLTKTLPYDVLDDVLKKSLNIVLLMHIRDVFHDDLQKPK